MRHDDRDLLQSPRVTVFHDGVLSGAAKALRYLGLAWLPLLGAANWRWQGLRAEANRVTFWSQGVPGAGLAAVAPPSANYDVAAKLIALADLRDRGVVTAAEFESKDAELLSRT